MSDQFKRIGAAIKRAATATANTGKRIGVAIKRGVLATPGQLKRAGRAIKRGILATPGQLKRAGRAIKRGVLATPGQLKRAGRAIKRGVLATPGQIKRAARATWKGIKIAAVAVKRAAIATWRYVKTLPGLTAVILSALTIASTTMLSVQLYDFTTVDEKEVLLQSDLQKEIELFSVQYENATGEITVVGADGQSVVAPGTAVEYTLRLRNKDKIAIDYDLIPAVSYTSEHTVPIKVRMMNTDGDYIIGDAKTWVAVEDISSLSEKATLVKGESAEYLFEWKWAYESGDDEYDTFLGNLQDDASAGVQVSFELYAEANTDIGTNGGVMESGLGEIIFTGASLAGLATTTTLMIVYTAKKRRKTQAS